MKKKSSQRGKIKYKDYLNYDVNWWINRIDKIIKAEDSGIAEDIKNAYNSLNGTLSTIFNNCKPKNMKVTVTEKKKDKNGKEYIRKRDKMTYSDGKYLNEQSMAYCGDIWAAANIDKCANRIIKNIEYWDMISSYSGMLIEKGNLFPLSGDMTDKKTPSGLGIFTVQINILDLLRAGKDLFKFTGYDYHCYLSHLTGYDIYKSKDKKDKRINNMRKDYYHNKIIDKDLIVTVKLYSVDYENILKAYNINMKIIKKLYFTNVGPMPPEVAEFINYIVKIKTILKAMAAGKKYNSIYIRRLNIFKKAIETCTYGRQAQDESGYNHFTHFFNPNVGERDIYVPIAALQAAYARRKEINALIDNIDRTVYQCGDSLLTDKPAKNIDKGNNPGQYKDELKSGKDKGIKNWNMAIIGYGSYLIYHDKEIIDNVTDIKFQGIPIDTIPQNEYNQLISDIFNPKCVNFHTHYYIINRETGKKEMQEMKDKRPEYYDLFISDGYCDIKKYIPAQIKACKGIENMTIKQFHKWENDMHNQAIEENIDKLRDKLIEKHNLKSRRAD